MKALCLILLLGLAGAVVYYEARLAPETATLQATLREQAEKLRSIEEKDRQSTQSLKTLSDALQAAKDALKAKEDALQAVQARAVENETSLANVTCQLAEAKAQIAKLSPGAGTEILPPIQSVSIPAPAPAVNLAANGAVTVPKSPDPKALAALKKAEDKLDWITKQRTNWLAAFGSRPDYDPVAQGYTTTVGTHPGFHGIPKEISDEAYAQAKQAVDAAKKDVGQ